MWKRGEAPGYRTGQQLALLQPIRSRSKISAPILPRHKKMREAGTSPSSMAPSPAQTAAGLKISLRSIEGVDSNLILA
nr:unnamed protein product [Digitaria exilis]